MTPPACRKCEHFISYEARCRRAYRDVFDPVSGRTTRFHEKAEVQRDDGRIMAVLMGTCGRAGRHFEPRKPAPECTHGPHLACLACAPWLPSEALSA